MSTPAIEPSRPLAIGDAAPDFELNDRTGQRHWFSDLRGAPVLLAFHPPHWDPSWAESVRAYNRLIASLPGAPGARLLSIAGDGAWQSALFDDGAMNLPVISLDTGPVAEQYGVTGVGAVFVVDAEGRISWRHMTGDAPPAPNGAASPLVTEVSGDGADDSTSPSGTWTRRRFVATTLAAAVALAFARRAARAEAVAGPVAKTPDTTSPVAAPVRLRVNGRDLSLDLEPRVTLLDALREYAGITGPKKGCDHGQCGACTVHVNGRRILSCLTLAVMQQGKEITTIEGLAATAGATGDALHPMQQAFIDHDGFQCGYCTSGQIMSASAVLREPWGPSDDDVREAMSGNICRCGAYPGIVAAIQQVRKQTPTGSNGGRR
jgi:xanthine dehydrogenase YagT iron-sulfur-binding subunit